MKKFITTLLLTTILLTSQVSAMPAFGINGEIAPKQLRIKAEQYRIAQESQRQYEQVQEQLRLEGEAQAAEAMVPQEEEQTFMEEFDKVLDVNINLGDSIIVVKLDANGFDSVSRETKAYAIKVIEEFMDKGYEDFEFQFWSVTDDIGKVCSFTIQRGTYEKGSNLILEDYWLSPAVK